jgi:hypothetical protein
VHAGNHGNSATIPTESVIEALARETGAEPDYIRQLYEHEFAQLAATATVRGFLSLIASRNVKRAMQGAGTHASERSPALPSRTLQVRSTAS